MYVWLNLKPIKFLIIKFAAIFSGNQAIYSTKNPPNTFIIKSKISKSAFILTLYYNTMALYKNKYKHLLIYFMLF
jgi:hypothetical protein